MEIDVRNCVICGGGFKPEHPDAWTCSEACYKALSAKKRAKAEEEAREKAEAEPELAAVSSMGESEAEKAVRYFATVGSKIPSSGKKKSKPVYTSGEKNLGGAAITDAIDAAIEEARREREKLGEAPLLIPAGDSTSEECLQAGVQLAQLSGEMSGLEDSYVLLQLSQGYLDRVRDALERSLAKEHGIEELEPRGVGP